MSQKTKLNEKSAIHNEIIAHLVFHHTLCRFDRKRCGSVHLYRRIFRVLPYKEGLRRIGELLQRDKKHYFERSQKDGQKGVQLLLPKEIIICGLIRIIS